LGFRRAGVGNRDGAEEQIGNVASEVDGVGAGAQDAADAMLSAAGLMPSAARMMTTPVLVAKAIWP